MIGRNPLEGKKKVLEGNEGLEQIAQRSSGSPSLKAFKARLDRAQHSLI